MLGSACIAEYIHFTAHRVFTFPGGTVAPIYDELIKIGCPIYTARHEQGAGYAALACARLSGRPEVVMVTSGPGVTNLLTVLADAFYDSTPLLALTGQVGTCDFKAPRPVRQKGFQEVNTPELVRTLVKAVFQPLTPSELPEVLEHAFYLAAEGRPGPVVIDMPMDVQRGEFSPTHRNAPRRSIPVQLPDMTTTLAAVADSKKPIILAGQGVLLDQATVALRDFALRQSIPVVSSLLGLGSMPGDSYLHVGFVGHTGMQVCGKALQEADCVIVLGARLDVRQSGTLTENFCPEARIIRVDIDPAELKHPRVRTDIAIQARVIDALAALNTLPHPDINVSAGRISWLEHIRRLKDAFPVDGPSMAHAGLSGVKVVRCFDRLTQGKKVIVSTGVGTHQHWTARHFTFEWPERVLLTSGGHGTMGYDVPSIMGAALVRPEAISLCFVGDASFQLNLQELQFAVDYSLPVRIVVLDNSRMALVSQFQRLTWGRDPVTGCVVNPNFAAIARAYGYAAETIETESQLEVAVQRCLATNGPYLLHCRIHNGDDVIPMLLGGQTLDSMYPFAE